MDMAALPRFGISVSAMEASTTASSAASTAAMETTTPATMKTAPAAAGALKTAALSPSRELLAACRTPLGKGARLSPVAGIEGRSLCGNAARAGRPAELRGAKVGALRRSLGAGHLSARTRCKPLSSRVGRRQTGLPRRAGNSRMDLPCGRGTPSGVCRCGRGEPSGSTRRGTRSLSREAAIVPAS